MILIKHTLRGAKYHTTQNTNPSPFKKFRRAEFFADRELFDVEIWPTSSKVVPTGRKARLVLNCADLNLAKFSLYIVLKFHCTLESVRLNIFENLPCEVPEKIRYSSTDRTVCLIQMKSDST